MPEYLAENSRLRQLSRRYSEGELSFGEYRAARRDIIEALEAGRVQTSAAPLQAEPRPEAASVTGEFTMRRPPEDETVFLKTMPPRVAAAEAVALASAPVVPAGWDGHTRILAAVLGGALLLALGALLYVFAL